jgi:DNA-binding transcriptional regulator PaaX
MILIVMLQETGLQFSVFTAMHRQSQEGWIQVEEISVKENTY